MDGPDAITVDLVRALVARQFPQWAQLPVRPVARQGHDNRTFRLGDELAVRLPSDDAYVPGIAKEHGALIRLAPHLDIALPAPVATGAPSPAFPRPWSVRRWLPGEIASVAPGLDRPTFARDLARGLVALRDAPAAGGPACGAHSFYRGCHPSVYSDEVQRALATLGDAVDGPGCQTVWDQAMRSAWPAPPVWFHGDIAPDNLLVIDGRLSAVIDFGTCGVGDPACDLVIAWTFMGDERATFRQAVGLDDDTWRRARGWALWKALITLADAGGDDDATRAATASHAAPRTASQAAPETASDAAPETASDAAPETAPDASRGPRAVLAALLGDGL